MPYAALPAWMPAGHRKQMGGSGAAKSKKKPAAAAGAAMNVSRCLLAGWAPANPRALRACMVLPAAQPLRKYEQSPGANPATCSTATTPLQLFGNEIFGAFGGYGGGFGFDDVSP